MKIINKLKRYLFCGYCGKLLTWRWIWQSDFKDKPDCNCHPIRDIMKKSKWNLEDV